MISFNPKALGIKTNFFFFENIVFGQKFTINANANVDIDPGLGAGSKSHYIQPSNLSSALVSN